VHKKMIKQQSSVLRVPGNDKQIAILYDGGGLAMLAVMRNDSFFKLRSNLFRN